MKWYLINKSNSFQPNSGNYNDPKWKEQIRVECYNQCIYCAINDTAFGGPRNFHIEHYRPKSLAAFKHLVKDIKNLFYACGICNTFKGDDWPSDWTEKNSTTIAYPDPSLFDYSELFDIDSNFLLQSNLLSGRYIINKLFLNRPQLIFERREFALEKRCQKAMDDINAGLIELLKDKKNSAADILNFMHFEKNIRDLLSQRRRISPYSIFDITKDKHIN